MEDDEGARDLRNPSLFGAVPEQVAHVRAGEMRPVDLCLGVDEGLSEDLVCKH